MGLNWSKDTWSKAFGKAVLKRSREERKKKQLKKLEQETDAKKKARFEKLYGDLVLYNMKDIEKLKEDYPNADIGIKSTPDGMRADITFPSEMKKQEADRKEKTAKILNETRRLQQEILRNKIASKSWVGGSENPVNKKMANLSSQYPLEDPAKIRKLFEKAGIDESMYRSDKFTETARRRLLKKVAEDQIADKASFMNPQAQQTMNQPNPEAFNDELGLKL